MSTYGVSLGETASCFSRKSFSNLYFCLSLVVLKTRWVLVLTCSGILLVLSVVRVDVILCAVDSASFIASPLALYVSLIGSLRNLMDASLATLRAPSVGTGGRTCTSIEKETRDIFSESPLLISCYFVNGHCRSV